MFVFLSLFLIVGVLAFISMTTFHERNARSLIEDELKQTASATELLVSSHLENKSQAVSMLSKDYAFQQAFSTGEMNTVSSAMESLRGRTHADLMMLLAIEDQHKILVDIPQGKLAGTDFPYPEMIEKAEDSGRPQAAFITLHDHLYSVIIIPILAPEPLTWFCIGFRVDSKFLKDLQKFLFSPDMSLVHWKPGNQPRILASTLATDSWQLVSRNLSQVSFNKEISTMTLGTDRFLVKAKTLEERTGNWLMIQHSLEEALKPYYELQRIFLAIGVAGLFITLIGAIAISRSVSRPVRELAETSRMVARGIYDLQVNIDLEDEIGELGRSFNQMTEGLAERDRIQDMLGKVVSPAIAEELLKSKELVLGGAEKEATILFSDIRDFTSLSEGRAPSDILTILNHYLTKMNDIVEANGGVVDKFIGDAIMALFGTPIRHDDDPDRAMITALAMIEELKKINVELGAKGFPKLKIGIGINTDIVVAGNMGSRNRLNYTVIGDGVNLASRLESQCKTYNQTIIISEQTLSKAKKKYKTESLGEVTVKGKKEATRIFGLIGLDS